MKSDIDIKELWRKQAVPFCRLFRIIQGGKSLQEKEGS